MGMTYTSDEIKKGLECCMDYQNCTEGEDPQCPYYDVKRCMEALLADALALIRWHEEKNEAMHAEIVRLQAERDAALADFKLYRERNIKGECGVYACDLCKNGGKYEELEENKCPKGCMGLEHWQWRGVQKEATP